MLSYNIPIIALKHIFSWTFYDRNTFQDFFWTFHLTLQMIFKVQSHEKSTLKSNITNIFHFFPLKSATLSWEIVLHFIAIWVFNLMKYFILLIVHHFAAFDLFLFLWFFACSIITYCLCICFDFSIDKTKIWHIDKTHFLTEYFIINIFVNWSSARVKLHFDNNFQKVCCFYAQ